MEQKQYKVAACLLIKDEGRYLPEWLSWHISQGIEHFYIYDNGSAIPVTESVPAEYAEMVTIIDFPPPRKYTQADAYDDCLARFASDADWIAFLDTDEFLRVVDGSTVQEFITNYGDADAVLAKWIVYDADGQIEDTGGPVRERFTHKTDLYPYSMPQCKSIVRTLRVRNMGAHGPIATQFSLRVVNENNERVRQGGGELPGEKIVVDHYFTRSYAEWKGKMSRGSCDPTYVRGNEWFLKLNPDLADAVAAFEEANKTE